MNRTNLFLIILCVFFLPLQSFSQEKDTVIWVENDFPPVWIYDGSYKGTGGADLIQKLLMEKLGNYNHRKVKANVTRTNNLLEKEKTMCSCATFKTPDREKIMLFNKIPSSFIFANGIITKRSKQHFFGNSKKISLANSVKNQKLILGITQDRKYSKNIDQILEKHKGNSNIYTRASQDLTKGLVSMLLNDRVDYILGYDWELQYLLKQFFLSEEADKLIFLPIQETEPYLISYIACSKNDW